MRVRKSVSFLASCDYFLSTLVILMTRVFGIGVPEVSMMLLMGLWMMVGPFWVVMVRRM